MIHCTMPLRRIFQDTSISMRTPMVAVWKKLRTGSAAGSGTGHDSSGVVFHVHGRLLGHVKFRRIAERVVKSELRIAISRPAVARWTDDRMRF